MALPLKVGVVLAVASTTSTRHLQLFLLLAGVFVRFYFVFPSCCFLPGLVFAMLSPFVRYFVLVGASSYSALLSQVILPGSPFSRPNMLSPFLSPLLQMNA